MIEFPERAARDESTFTKGSGHSFPAERTTERVGVELTCGAPASVPLSNMSSRFSWIRGFVCGYAVRVPASSAVKFAFVGALEIEDVSSAPPACSARRLTEWDFGSSVIGHVAPETEEARLIVLALRSLLEKNSAPP